MQTSTWSFFTREFTEPSKEEKQMNTVVNVCASSYGTMQWPDIKWVRCIRKVRRLQMRIVKATQGGRWNKVKVLQRLLTGSFFRQGISRKEGY
jgi:RNA-directed DNA polymerase